MSRLHSYYRRRIALPDDLDRSSLVLDVGSGDKPHWRADILVDRFPEAEHAVQRSGAAAARTPRPLFDADIADMPFADKVFDYVVCSHVLEHVLDPGAAIREMVRVGNAGYVEVPRAAGSKIIDFPSHLWWCREEGETLVLEAKRSAAFDTEIEELVRRPEIERELNALIDRRLDDFVIARPWRDDLPFRVEGIADPGLVTADAVHHKQVETMLSRALTMALTLSLRGRRRGEPVTWNAVVKPELWRAPDEVLSPRRYSTVR